MKIKKITEDKISNVINFLQELSWLKDLDYVEDLSNGDFPILESLSSNKIENVIEQDPLEFLRGLGYYVKQLHFEMLSVNLKTLLDNCADINNNVLEFKAEITSALEVNNKIAALKEKRQAELAENKGLHTTNPIFIVYQKGTYCVDSDDDMYHKNSVFGYEPREMAVSEDGDSEIYLDETELEENSAGNYYDEEYEILYNRFVKECYYDKFVTFAFTREGAEKYIKSNSHNLNSPRIYVDHIPYRNTEICEVLALLGDKIK